MKPKKYRFTPCHNKDCEFFDTRRLDLMDIHSVAKHIRCLCCSHLQTNNLFQARDKKVPDVTV
jgi:hypothetical protein